MIILLFIIFNLLTLSIFSINYGGENYDNNNAVNSLVPY